MVHRFFHSLVVRTHFWRFVGFAELAELYASRMMRVMAIQIIGGFAAVFMYQQGFSLHFIAMYLCGYFLLRACIAPIVALIIARYGPKHATLISNILHIMSAITLIFLPNYGVVILLIYAPLAAFAQSLYDISYLVDFSKVKHVDHSGKELGVMQIIERIMIGLGPLVGGLVALAFGAQAMIVFGSFLMILAATPLFFTGEPVKVRQHITLRHFNWKSVRSSMLGNIGMGIDMDISGFLWRLFIAIVILGVSNNPAIYAQIGALGSISIFASLIVAYFYGKVVDNKKGRALLNITVFANAIIHVLRPFIVTPTQVVATNVANEATTAGYTISATRGIFDTADGLPGYRIVYLTIMNMMMMIGDALVMATLAVLTFSFTEQQSIQMIYFIFAPLTLLILFHGKGLYRQGILTRFIHRV